MAKKVLMKGNEAIAEAAIKSGCLHFFGYPITPQTEISEYMAKRMPKVGGLCLQAESEVSAINMIMGAAASGSRCLTSSSSPGISLKSEGISYLVGCDLPCVIVNVQRGGPGLGGIQPSQQDYYQATKANGHGDEHILVLAPSSVQEMAQLTSEAFDLADIYRMPAMILADGALGQMMEPVDFDVMSKREVPEKTWACNGTEGKRKKNIVNSLLIDPNELEASVLARFKRYDEIAEKEVKYEEYKCDDADIVIVAYGIKVGLFRPITLWPYPKKQLGALADTAKRFLVCELNMGQMVDDVKVSIDCKKPVSFFGRTGGVIPSPDEVLAEIEKLAAAL